MRTRSNCTLGSGRRGGQSRGVGLNLGVASRPRQAAVEIGAGRDGGTVWCYVCRAAWSVWCREHRPQTHIRRRGGMGRTVRWARAVGEERDWMRRAGLRQCMDHDAVGGCGCRTSTRAGPWSVGGEETASWWGRGRCRCRRPSCARGGVEYLAGGGGAEVCRLQRRQRPLFVITYLLYTAMLPSVPRWRLVSSAVSGQAWARVEISFAS